MVTHGRVISYYIIVSLLVYIDSLTYITFDKGEYMNIEDFRIKDPLSLKGDRVYDMILDIFLTVSEVKKLKHPSKNQYQFIKEPIEVENGEI